MYKVITVKNPDEKVRTLAETMVWNRLNSVLESFEELGLLIKLEDAEEIDSEIAKKASKIFSFLP